MEVVHVERSQAGRPEENRGGENKVRADSAQHSSDSTGRAEGRRVVKRRKGQLRQTSRSTDSAGEGEGGQQLSFASDGSMSAACLAWTGPVQFQGRGGHTTDRMETRASSAQPVVWTYVRPAGGFEVEELATGWKTNRHGFDQQGHFWEGPINEDTAAQNKASRTWESFNRGLVYLNKPA